MNQLVTKWLEELRNAETKQCKLCIRQDDGFCALGVLGKAASDIYPDRFVWTLEEDGGWVFTDKESGTSVTKSIVMLLSVLQMVGMHSNFQLMCNGRSISNMNDSGMALPDIADVIEESYADGTIQLSTN